MRSRDTPDARHIPIFHQVECDHLRAKIAHRLLRGAHVSAQDGEQRLVRLAAAHQLHGRDLQPFLEHFARLGAADLAADIRRVRGRCAECDQPAVAKDRPCDRDVVQVAGAEPDVVGNEDVARGEAVRRE